MNQIIQDIVSSNNWTIKNIEVMSDHIHLLLSFPPKYSGSSVLKSLKGGSAKKWFEKYPEDKKILCGGNLWSKSYFISTLGDMSKDVVDKYIDNQLTEYNNGKLRKDTRY